MIVCFLATFDYAFKNNGGIGGWFDAHVENDPCKYFIYFIIYNPDHYSYSQFIFDNLNNILIQMISIQIFSGIIIDTFSSLREKQLLKDTDIEEICFICGLPRELFDRRSDYGFTQHTK